MESTVIESKNAGKVTSSASTASTGSNQLYIAENMELDLPEDTFRMNLDNFSDVGENVTISERDSSVDTVLVGTPMPEIPTSLQTPDIQTPLEKAPPIIDTPVSKENMIYENIQKTRTLLKLSLKKNHDNDMFVKPSPVAEIMSPARMLQYQLGSATPYTPTMKRAAIDFDFFSKNKFEKYFKDDPEEQKTVEVEDRMMEIVEDNSSYKENLTVIIDPNTVRHEIGDGKYMVPTILFLLNM